MVQNIFSNNRANPKGSTAITETNLVKDLDENLSLADDFWEINKDSIVHLPPKCHYEISMDCFFNARHFVIIGGKKGLEHSHSYRLRVCCQGRSLDQREHVLVDYCSVREQIKLVARVYNNQLLNDLPVFKNIQPTTEALTAVIFQQLRRLLIKYPIELVSITLWDSPTEAITVFGDGFRTRGENED